MLKNKALAAAPSAVPQYIEDVFSTYLYAGNDSTQTITNGIDLAGKGGMVWIKQRDNYEGYSNDPTLVDTARGVRKGLFSNRTDAQNENDYVMQFLNNGFTVGYTGETNQTVNRTYVSWTFRKAPKFFDVVTYTGNGANGHDIAHNLGSVPGMIICKATSTESNWGVWHRKNGNDSSIFGISLNSNFAALSSTAGGTSVITSTTFNPGIVADPSGIDSNANGVTYVAYLFAHDAGGFGESGTDNIVSCGSYTGTGASGNFVSLGYEPQWVMVKRAVGGTSHWYMLDTMRGIVTGGNDPRFQADQSDAEFTEQDLMSVTATGFELRTDGAWNISGSTYIYLAIRRGPMKKPTSGTSVFGLSARTGTGTNATVTGGQTNDAVIIKNRGSAVGDLFAARLTGTGYLETSSTAAEVAAGTTILQANPWDVMDGVKVGTTSTITNASSNTFINYLFRRAPGFFDVVCYTGSSDTNQRVVHNLGAVPELIITRRRTFVTEWFTYHSSFTRKQFIELQSTAARTTAGVDVWGSSNPTTTDFGISSPNLSFNNYTCIAYLFATLPGVSKVGSYTGTGTAQQINCGFSTGAKFVLIKRTDSTGNWYFWDTARGISTSNDPYLLLNSTAAEVTNTDYIDPLASGFEISSTASAEINANGGTFIYLAIA